MSAMTLHQATVVLSIIDFSDDVNRAAAALIVAGLFDDVYRSLIDSGRIGSGARPTETAIREAREVAGL